MKCGRFCRERAESEAITVFEENLRTLLLAPPAGPIGVMGVDPGQRTGCKIAVVDVTGKFLENQTIYLTEPKQDLEGAEKTLLDLVQRHNVRGIAIGNGTGSRETDSFIRTVVEKNKLDVFVVVVNESGASIYSASKRAREEFPKLDVTVRGAISIARRLQDPLAEFVKTEPKSIGVGQYQHDVDQKKLKRSLAAAVESCVNRVGVDLNSASVDLLKYVSGIGDKLAQNVVAFRDQHGLFRNRTQLREIEGFGDKTFEQAAGFLRIKDGENPLDRTAVHPESYSVVERMASSLGISLAELIENPAQVNSIDFKTLENEAGKFTAADIREELLKPGRDPRDKFVVPKFRDDVKEIADLKEGMELEGTVTNVTNFGAFVDLGVHQDGLVHISELSHKYVQDARQAVKVGEIVKVKVIGVDRDDETDQPLDESDHAETAAPSAAQKSEASARSCASGGADGLRCGSSGRGSDSSQSPEASAAGSKTGRRPVAGTFSKAFRRNRCRPHPSQSSPWRKRSGCSRKSSAEPDR